MGIKKPSLPKTRKEAVACGSEFYFTGNPCKNGHLVPRRTNGWGCQQCSNIRHRNIPRDKILEYERKRRLRHPQRFKKYYEANKEKCNSESNKWHAENRPRINKDRRDRYKNDIQYKLATRLRARINAALKRKNSLRSDGVLKLLGCPSKDAIAWLEKQFKEGMTWDNWSHKGWHIDHIRPLSSFNLADKYQLAQACHYTNLQPMWSGDNWSKGAKV